MDQDHYDIMSLIDAKSGNDLAMSVQLLEKYLRTKKFKTHGKETQYQLLKEYHKRNKLIKLFNQVKESDDQDEDEDQVENEVINEVINEDQVENKVEDQVEDQVANEEQVESDKKQRGKKYPQKILSSSPMRKKTSPFKSNSAFVKNEEPDKIDSKTKIKNYLQSLTPEEREKLKKKHARYNQIIQVLETEITDDHQTKPKSKPKKTTMKKL